MTTSEPMHNLTEDQLHLVEAVTSREYFRTVVVAPPGTGKTYAVSAAIVELLAGVPDARVLLLAPSALCAYHVAMLADRLQSGTPVVEVTGKVINNDLSAHSLDSGGGLRPGVYVVSTGIAKREDVRAKIAASEWDLVVVDEAHAIPASLIDLVVDLADGTRVRSLVLLSVMTLKDPRLTDCLEAVIWARKNRETSPRFQTVINYVRTAEEQELYRRLAEFLAVQTNDSLIKNTIERAWRSSIISLEQVLLRALSRLEMVNSTLKPPGFKPLPSFIPSARSDQLSSGDQAEKGPVWLDDAAAAEGIDLLLRHISELHSDSKLEAVLATIEYRREQGATLPSVVTEMRETAVYIDQALNSRGRESVRIDGQQTALQRSRASCAVGEIVVATDAGLRGFALEADTILNYDLPRSRIRMEERWGRIDRIGREQPVTMLALRDTSAVDNVEEGLLRLHGYI